VVNEFEKHKSTLLILNVYWSSSTGSRLLCPW